MYFTTIFKNYNAFEEDFISERMLPVRRFVFKSQHRVTFCPGAILGILLTPSTEDKEQWASLSNKRII